MDKKRYRRVKPGSGGMEMPETESAPHYPTLSFRLEDLPEAKGWEIGQTYRVSLELKQVGIYQREGKGDATFEIHGISVEK